MVKRQFWIDKIEAAWQERSIIWLVGVRRVGKTYLCQSLDKVIYYDCERQQVRQRIEDNYEAFLNEHDGMRIILDEIHKLSNPSEILKVAADHYPNVKIIATGSSSLEASRKFSDTLTGRKHEIRLLPMLSHESELFGNASIPHRMHYGGLPPFFLSKQFPELGYTEWFSSYWAKDIQELFRVGKRASFMKFVELMFAQSGSMFTATTYARASGVSSKTIANYLEVTRETMVSIVVKPFSKDPLTEIRSMPKIYSFDSGFASYGRLWTTLRQEDYGILWEHLVLNELLARYVPEKIRYWRDKRSHEIDFIVLKSIKSAPDTIECKWNSRAFSTKNLKFFRERYPEGANYLVAQDIAEPYVKNIDGLDITMVPLKALSTLFPV